jgi:hypothetical protein
MVRADGSPASQLSGGLVVFSSQMSNISRWGDQYGRYVPPQLLEERRRFAAGDVQRDGQPARGVLSEFANASERKAARDAVRSVPAKYGHPSTSPLMVTVEPKVNQVTVKLDKNPGRRQAGVFLYGDPGSKVKRFFGPGLSHGGWERLLMRIAGEICISSIGRVPLVLVQLAMLHLTNRYECGAESEHPRRHGGRVL